MIFKIEKTHVLKTSVESFNTVLAEIVIVKFLLTKMSYKLSICSPVFLNYIYFKRNFCNYVLDSCATLEFYFDTLTALVLNDLMIPEPTSFCFEIS